MANQTDREIAVQFLNGIQAEIVNKHEALGQKASGETIQALRVEPTEKGGILFGPEHLFALETGRGPTKGGGAGGGQSLQSRIFDWLQFKKYGINYENTQERKSISFAIAKTIHEKGTKLFRDRANSGLLTDIITANRLAAMTGAFGRNKATGITSDILPAFK